MRAGAEQRDRRVAGRADDGDAAPFALMSGTGATVFLASPEHAGLAFDVTPPATAPAGGGLRIVETRTARRVARVAVAD
jgi:hypothetical protein